MRAPRGRPGRGDLGAAAVLAAAGDDDPRDRELFSMMWQYAVTATVRWWLDHPDEPAAGMNPVEAHEITELIARLRADAGYTILVIEHDMHVVEGVSDRVIALDHGEKIAEGSFDAVATDPRVVEAYLGRGTAARR